MTWLRRLEAWIRKNPGKLDTTVAVLLMFPASLLYGISLTGVDSQPLVVGLVTMVLLALAFAWRRSHPRRALWIAAGAGLLQAFFMIVTMGGPEVSPLIVLIPTIAYSAVVYGQRRDARWSVIWCVVGSLLGGFAWATDYYEGLPVPNWRSWVAGTLFIGAVCAVAIVSGYMVRARRLAQQALADRAERLEAEQEQERALAAADERRRIAREMHDVVAHSLSVVIAQADGARYAAAANPEIATQTLGTIAATSREALKEMRSLLGVLRTEDDEAAPKTPAPDLSLIPQLVENIRGSGLQLQFHQLGQPRRGLPAGAELAAYRAAQEALTNVLKHAGADALAALTMTWTPHGLDLEVADTGVGSTTTDGMGRGQQGMLERVSLYGGTADFRPGRSGYTVRVFLPYEEI
ncbi:MAG: sensor histidine kinase [Galactobacter sp.]